MENSATYFTSLLKTSWQGAVLILLVLAVQWLFGRRLLPRWRYALWLLVMIRLALPWTIPTRVSLFNVLNVSGVSASFGNARHEANAAGSRAAQPTAAMQAARPDVTSG